MKTSRFNQMLWGTLLGLSLFACKAPEVKNHVEERGHEMPWSIALLFTPGTVQDTTEFYANGFAPSGEASLTYKVTTNAEEGGVAKSEPIHLKKGVWYRLSISFYNKSGVLLNEQYLTLEQAPMHQFFFTCTRLKDVAQKFPSKIATQVLYKYMDKERIQGERQPIGFEGVLRLKDEVAYKDFNLRALLVHVTPPATKKSKAGAYYPFDAPGRHLLGVTDMDIQIPIIVQ